MNRTMKFAALAVVVIALVGVNVARAAHPPEAPTVILIQNATILTVSHGTIEHGSILIKDGKIAEVGPSIKAPKDAQVIDAAGQFVMPGIIDCHSHIAIDGSVNEGSVSVSSMANIAEVLNSDDIDIYRDLAGGVTVANVLHGSANAIGGQTVVIKLRWGQPAAKLPFEGAVPGIKFALGENPKRSNFSLPGQPKRYPATRMGVEETIRGAFIEARDYKKAWDDYNKRTAAGEKNLIAPRRDLRLEPLVEVLEGKRYVHSHCYREDEILMLLRVAKEFGFKVRTFQHILEGYKVADELAAAGVGASTFSDWWAYKVEAYDAIPYNAAFMTRRGVIVSINSDDAEEATHLNQEAAKSMKFGGLSRDEALKMVTLNPALQLGIDKRVGTIDAGKDADLVIYNHDPLSAYAVVQKTLIDGRVYFDRQRDIAERPEREKEKKALLEKEKKSAEKKPDATVTIGQKPDEKKPEAKKPEEKKPEEKKPEQKPKPPQVANDHREGAERNLAASLVRSGGAW
ncbi:MAG TPA: amidohydrolase [Candidatus Acidoferrum sp.]|jgi:imidazolonepropionase-like amidohydrolase|nr:amidohydrolase [Candidatus Acidoferrum sp.]